ncbi:hypothetical protein BDD43_1303 [Mucilaginibacter gracilis]|uniref:Uncharacterized protein n=1 Tax=Mucilaginibacter gracilis TaxID=423350 RepID=A0A495IZ93_9SPHI|nr:hypothetical protein [Mucilaginibacter gracilis]RKR81159.1 hypothetical protein BDD43_1303 [Mucilaginibacter gracilis]
MKRAIIMLVIVLAIAELIALATGFCLIVPISKVNPKPVSKTEDARTIAAFKGFDFTKDNWAAYVAIAPDDFATLNPQLPKIWALKTTNRHVLQQMQRTWLFTANGEADVATVTSTFYLLRNHKLVYQTGIVLDSTITALQNSVYGEMMPVDKNEMVASVKQFKRVYWPIVVF